MWRRTAGDCVGGALSARLLIGRWEKRAVSGRDTRDEEESGMLAPIRHGRHTTQGDVIVRTFVHCNYHRPTISLTNDG